MSEKHTKLPYSIYTEISHEIILVQDATDKTIGTINGGHTTINEDKANAEFIVRACNSHYELLEAVKRAKANCIDAIEFMDNSFEKRPVRYKAYKKKLAEYDALIAKAESKQTN